MALAAAVAVPAAAAAVSAVVFLATAMMGGGGGGAVMAPWAMTDKFIRKHRCLLKLAQRTPAFPNSQFTNSE